MTEKMQGDGAAQPLLELWMKTTSAVWQNALQNWAKTVGMEQKTDPDQKTRNQESLEAIQKAWQTLSSVMEEPETVQSMLGGISAMPEVALKLIQTGWQGVLNLQQQWIEKAARVGQSTPAYKFENLDQEALQAWTDLYEKELRQYINVPQVGLFRLYQERMAQSVDEHARFQSTVGEFLFMLYLPMEKSLKVMQDQLAQMAEEGQLPETSKDYYRIWIKILEGHYMTLFQSPEYTQALTKTLTSMSDYNLARKKILEDMLRPLPIPSQSEMDELYKEIYQLKKRVKFLEKAVARSAGD